MEIIFGAMAPKFGEQPIAEKLGRKELAMYQADSDAITRLLIRGMITNRDGDKARTRLGKQMTRSIKAATK